MVIVSALVATSLLAGAVQDIKENQISDLTWIPAIIGAIVMIYQYIIQSSYIFLALKFVMVAMVLSVSYFFGGGMADMIGLAVVVVDDDPFAPIGTLVVFVAVTITYAVYSFLMKKQRRTMIPLTDFLKKKNVYPVKVYVEGREEKLPKTADKAYEVLETILKENKEAVVEAETGIPAVVPMCVGYVVNMMIFFYLGRPWFSILFKPLTS